MWIKKSAAFILIQYRGKGKLKFTFPISLYAFLDVFDAFNDLRKIVKTIFPAWYGKTMRKISTSHVPIEELIELVYQLFYVVKNVRRVTLVEVDLDEVYIKVAIF